MSLTKKLPGLDGLRAIAAVVVLIGHVYLIAGTMGQKEFTSIFASIGHSGKNMVTLFFVISGFIISYLLLNEKASTNTISLIQFYKKRALRIWPLYFLIFFVAYLISVNTSLYQNFGSFTSASVIAITFFGVNIANVLSVPFVVLSHYWSLSVEEQFYLFWPVLLKKINLLKVCCTVIIIQFVLRNGAAYLSHHSNNETAWTAINGIFNQSLFSCMAIGGLLAIALYENWKTLRYVRMLWVKILTWVLFFFVSFCPLSIPYIQSEIAGFVYALTIANAIAVENPRFLDSKISVFVGKISYGVYMYHVPLIPLLIVALQAMGAGFFFMYYGLPLVALAILITLLISYLSYNYFEVPFLKLKTYTFFQKKISSEVN